MSKDKNIAVPAEESAGLRFLYHTFPGRLVLRLLTARSVSRLAGRFLDSRLSRRLIPSFVNKHGISLSDYEEAEFQSFNQFFTRKIKDGLRPVAQAPEDLIAPCDGLLSVYEITDGLVMPVKQSRYTVASLLGDTSAAAEYDGGLCLVFRLCVDNYHRYCYFDGGSYAGAGFIPGRLHTVRPIALQKFPVFTENCRAYTLIDTDNFGLAAQLEVGAMLVSKICNYPAGERVERGQEKGKFLYGGSTIIVLLAKGRAVIDKEIREASKQGLEFPVKMGQRIGRRI